VKKITLDRVGEIVWRYHVPVGSGCDNLKIMFVGCSHLDSIECNRAKLKSVLNRAVDEGARIIFNGDNFDLMQGRNDPRRTKTAMKPEPPPTNAASTGWHRQTQGSTAFF